MLVISNLRGFRTHRVVDINAGIDNVGASTLASGIVIGVSLAASLVARDTGKTPGSIVLLSSSLDGDDGILLNVLDLFLLASSDNPPGVTHIRVVLELLNLIFLQGSSKAVEALGVGVVGISLDGRNSRRDRSSANATLHLDNVLAIDKLNATWAENGSRLSPLGGGGKGQGQKSEKSCGAHID